jgi:hypothetical protein
VVPSALSSAAFAAAGELPPLLVSLPAPLSALKLTVLPAVLPLLPVSLPAPSSTAALAAGPLFAPLAVPVLRRH